MAHFGILCLPTTGHRYPMTALGRALLKRGHLVTVFNVLDIQREIEQAGLGYYAIGQSDFPLGTLAKMSRQRGSLTGWAGLWRTLEIFIQFSQLVCRDAPDAIRREGVEVLLVDQPLMGGATVADYLGLPFITVCNALAMIPENLEFPLGKRWYCTIRNWIEFFEFDVGTIAIRSRINQYRQQWQLPLYKSFQDSFSTLAQVSQQTAEFDFPRQGLPACFHYCGPFLDDLRSPISFPYDRLNGQPLIYASLGTLQNRYLKIFDVIAQACADLEVQLVISLGGGGDVSELQGLPGSPLVVNYAPQLELLSRTAVTITHGGLNTVLESLTYGVPLVVIPITNDQPAIAARLQWTKAGKVVPLYRLTVARLQRAIGQVLTDDSYRNAAKKQQEEIIKAEGVDRAVDVILEALNLRHLQ